MTPHNRKLTRRIFLIFFAAVGVFIFTALGWVFWFLRRQCTRNHSVKNNPVPDDHFRTVIATRFSPPGIYNLDVTTVDSTSAIVTWATAEEATFKIEEASNDEALAWKEKKPSTFHMAELTGLRPDTDYSFRLANQRGNIEDHIRFRTLSDIGDVLFRFATFSDNHFKADSMSWPDGRYFRRCSDIHRCLIEDLNKEAPDFCINKGDLTDVYEPYRLRAYQQAVTGLKPPTYVIPGNHDHLRNEDFKRDWLDFVGTEQVYRSFDHKGFHLVLLDTCWTGEQERGFLGEEQIKWLTDDLEQNAAKTTFLFMHHPGNGDVEENRVIHDDETFQKAIARFPGVAAVFSAHVHRNYITHSPLTPDIPYIETASVIQYPNGYNLYEVSASGIKQVFKKLSDISLSEESWLASPLRCLTNPGEGLGSISHRNFILKF